LPAEAPPLWPTPNDRSFPMADHDRVEGAARNISGKIKEGFGNLTGDEKLKAEGKAEQVAGKVQNTIGGLRDSLHENHKRN
jgi:uncharacterized protein YjbJ (UPF0337 family)